MRHSDFQNRFSRHDRSMNRFRTVFFIVFGIALLMILGTWAFQGWAVYQIVSNPETVGNEIGKFLGGVMDGVKQ